MSENQGQIPAPPADHNAANETTNETHSPKFVPVLTNPPPYAVCVDPSATEAKFSLQNGNWVGKSSVGSPWVCQEDQQQHPLWRWLRSLLWCEAFFGEKLKGYEISFLNIQIHSNDDFIGKLQWYRIENYWLTGTYISSRKHKLDCIWLELSKELPTASWMGQNESPHNVDFPRCHKQAAILSQV